ncbi:hypothetical protein ACFV0R_22120 [Streptomyces sp. NPDC059578]|uniref:hypothetical protein n=1 Tax=Streptomyces sp. NPDC059578 TaxID=3346874 RepID=UPI003691BEF9
METMMTRPRAGVVDDVEREEDAKGLEPHDDPFHQLVKYLVADGDLRAARLGRSAPRTAAVMLARLSPEMGRPCTTCNGAGGKTEDTSSGGVTRQTWKRCGSCNGTGTR